jgi:hypothetical protein
MRDVPKPVVPIVLVGAVGALMISDFFRLPHDGYYSRARGAILLWTTVASALAAWILGIRWVRATTSRRVLTALIVSPLVGLLVGAASWVFGSMGRVSTRVPWDYWVADGAREGALSGVAFLPAVLAIVFASHRVGRARFGSFVDDADRRAPWLALGGFTVAGLPFVLAANQIWSYHTVVPLDVSYALAGWLGSWLRASFSQISLR